MIEAGGLAKGFAVLLIALLIAGAYISIEGYLLRASLQSATFSGLSEIDSIALFASNLVDQNKISVIRFLVDEISPRQNNARLTVVAMFSTLNSSDPILVFGVQVPNNFTNLKVRVDMTRGPPGSRVGQGAELPQQMFLGNHTAVRRESDPAYFWVVVNRTESGAYFDEFTFNAMMNWLNPLVQKSFSTYSLIVQLGFGIKYRIRESAPAQLVVLQPSAAPYSTLEVAEVPNSLLESDPIPDGSEWRSGELWKTWDMTKRIDPRTSVATAIVVDFEMMNLAEEKEQKMFEASWRLGLGPGAVISSIIGLFELWHRRGKNEDTNTSIAIKPVEVSQEEPRRRAVRRRRKLSRFRKASSRSGPSAR